MEDGQQAAWVAVNQDSTVSFINIHGHTLSCILENGLQVGSKCTVDDTVFYQVPMSTPKSNILSASRKVGQSVHDNSPSGCPSSTLLSPLTSAFSQQIRETSIVDQPWAFASTRKAACPASLKSRHAHRHPL